MLAQQIELVKTNCSVAGRTVATPLASIKELNTYYAQEVLAVKKRSQDLEEQLERLNEELEQREAQRDSVARIKLKSATEVDVKVVAQQAGRADFSITYYVKNAGWYPTYDVRSSSIREPLSLSYKANIYQNTKEEWKNVPVVLSNSTPMLEPSRSRPVTLMTLPVIRNTLLGTPEAFLFPVTVTLPFMFSVPPFQMLPPRLPAVLSVMVQPSIVISVSPTALASAPAPVLPRLPVKVQFVRVAVPQPLSVLEL